MLPAVCVPKASGKKPAATPAAEPEDEPPGVKAGLCGLVVGPGWRVANSVVTVLPITTAPSLRANATQAASERGRQPSQIGELLPVGMPATLSTSFTPSGRPRSLPPAGAASAARAARSAASASKWAKARSVGSRAAMRAKHASMTATAVVSPARIRRSSVVAGRSARSVMPYSP